MKDILDDREDFIWAIRQRNEIMRKEEDEKGGPTKKVTNVASLIALMDRSALLLASLIPDEVIFNVDDYAPKELIGCLLCGSVTGFAKLCALYNNGGGPSSLMAAMNNYVGFIVQEVMSFGGDVIEFSGESFVALWKCRENMSLRDNVHRAIDCALIVQKKYATFETDVGVVLRAKIALSAGQLVFSLIGDDGGSRFVLMGRPVNDVRRAEKFSEAGEITVAPSAWYNVNVSEYLAVDLANSYVRVVGIGPSWRRVEDAAAREHRVPSIAGSVDESATLTTSGGSDEEFEARQEEFSLRPSLRIGEAVIDKLKRFVVAPVLASVERRDPTESLYETRLVATVFANVVIKAASTFALRDVLDVCYKVACKHATRQRGHVHTVSVFERDAVFVAAFGLRGSSDELQSQRALRYAAALRRDALRIWHVASVSAACAMGKTFCGLVGHTLRRDYVVVGVAVNRAARMLFAYPDRVSCDRQTFMQSKMETSNFALQPYRPLKTVEDPGLVFEFREITRSVFNAMASPMNPRPILGRDHELGEYERLLDLFVDNQGSRPCCNELECSTIKALIVEGRPRQGKTRLLDEFARRAPARVPVIRIALRESDRALRYRTVRLIFAPTVGGALDERRLLRLVARNGTPRLMCALNDVFDVHFPESDEWKSFDEGNRGAAREKMVRFLCRRCFAQAWVVAIDDADRVDEASWRLIPHLVDSNRFFLAMTMLADAPFHHVADKLKRSKFVRTVTLNNVEKLFHGAIACQMMNVYALPADLEKVIQSNSNGNPGWIDGFLITLLQEHKIYIQKRDHRSIRDYGLVVPPLYMMHRLSPDQIEQWKNVLEEKSTGCRDKWHVYVDICRADASALLVAGAVDVCLLASNADLTNRVDHEISDDVRILQLFDLLNYREQFALKCGSVLGDTFSRKLLAYLVRPESQRSFGEAIQQLFEKGVLCCARGDFSSGGDYMLLRDKIADPGKDKGPVHCYCRGLDIDDSCYYMPKYASCGFLRFRSSSFRANTYGLLPDAQKRELHATAARYLTRETRKCVSCGGGYFPIMHTYRLDQRLMRQNKSAKKKKRQVTLEQMNFEELLNFSAATGKGSKTSSGFASWRRNQPNRSSSLPSIGADSTLGDDEESDDGHSHSKRLNTQAFAIFNLHERRSLTRTFSQLDFSSCECHLVLGAMFAQLRAHYRAAGDYTKMLDAIARYAKVAISAENYAAAVGATREGVAFLRARRELLDVDDGDVPNRLGQLYALRGVALTADGRAEEARAAFARAMACFGFPFPAKRLAVRASLWRARLRQRLGLYLVPGIFADKTLNANEAENSNNVSECLVCLCRLFLGEDKLRQAELAGTWALTISLEAESSLIALCDSFAAMIAIAQRRRNRRLQLALETHALRYCHRKYGAVEAPELRAVARLYAAVLDVRIARSEIENALHIGYIVLRIANGADAPDVTVRALPFIVASLIVKLYLAEASTVLCELEYFSDEKELAEGKTWFYAMSLLFHLETGYTFLPIQGCEVYFYEKGLDKMEAQFTEPQARFVISLWVWYLRNEQWEAASVVASAANTQRNRKICTNNEAFSSLLLLEGTLLYLVHKINTRNIGEIARTKREAKKLMNKLKDQSSSKPVILPRLYHLYAYYAFILNDEDKTKKYLKRARKECARNENSLELLHIEHSEKAWNNELQTAARDFWRSHCGVDNYLDYREIEGDDVKVYSFTYPMPLFEA